MKDIINRVYEKKLTDGTIERIVSEHFDKMISDICQNQMSWNGEAKKAVEERLKPIMLQAIERSDLSDLVTKITTVINAGIKGSSLEGFERLTSGIRNLFGSNQLIEKYKNRKSVKVSEIFEEYCEFVAKAYNDYDFEDNEVSYDDGKAAYIDCSMSVEDDTQNYFFRKNGYIVELTNEKSDDEKSTDIKFRLAWNYDNTSLKAESDFRSLSISDLRFMPPFLLFLSWLEGEYINIELDEREDSESAYVALEE